MCAHVAGDYLPASAAPAQQRQVDAELTGETADERRRTDALARRRVDDGDGGRPSRRRDLGEKRRRRPIAADRHEHGADRDDLTLADEDARDDAGGRRRDLDDRLVGLDLDERVILADLLPLRNEPACDLALRQALAEVGQPELVHQKSNTCRAAAATRATDGRYASSSCQYG